MSIKEEMLARMLEAQGIKPAKKKAAKKPAKKKADWEKRLDTWSKKRTKPTVIRSVNLTRFLKPSIQRVLNQNNI